MTGIDQIIIERNEQLTTHKRTVAQDKALNTENQLIDAVSQLIVNIPPDFQEFYESQAPPIGWNVEIWKNMLKKPYKERLVIAGALIAAEIDRIS